MGEGGQTHRHADMQTQRHFSTMTRPGLGAGPSENSSLVKIVCFVKGVLKV